MEKPRTGTMFRDGMMGLYIPREQAGRQKCPNQMLASIPRTQSTLNLFVHLILICQCYSQIFKPCHIFKKPICMLCPFFWYHEININLVFSGYTSRPTSLLVSDRAFVFFFMVSYVFSSYINVIGIGEEVTSSIQFQSFLVLLGPPNGIF
jgi:hypothetical protein